MRIARRGLVASVLVAAVLLFGSCASSPDLVIRGRVTDAATGLPVSGARVHEGRYAPDLAAGALTDGDGRFEYRSYPEEHNVIIEKEGYAPYKATVGLGLRPAPEAVVEAALTAAP